MLLHYLFNEFKAACENHKATREDNMLILHVSRDMSAFFSNEKARQTQFIDILGRHGLPMFTGEILGTSCRTGIDLRSRNGFPYFIGELKHRDEMGSKGPEPVFQSAVYYTAHLKQTNLCQPEALNSRSPYPCLVLYLIGDGPCMLFESIY